MKNLSIILFTFCCLLLWSCTQEECSIDCDELMSHTAFTIPNIENCTCECRPNRISAVFDDKMYCLLDMLGETEYLYVLKDSDIPMPTCSDESLIYLYLDFKDEPTDQPGRKKGNVFVGVGKQAWAHFHPIVFTYSEEDKSILNFGFDFDLPITNAWHCNFEVSNTFLSGEMHVDEEKVNWHMRLFESHNSTNWANDEDPDMIVDMEFVRYEPNI